MLSGVTLTPVQGRESRKLERNPPVVTKPPAMSQGRLDRFVRIAAALHCSTRKGINTPSDPATVMMITVNDMIRPQPDASLSWPPCPELFPLVRPLLSAPQ